MWGDALYSLGVIFNKDSRLSKKLISCYVHYAMIKVLGQLDYTFSILSPFTN